MPLSVNKWNLRVFFSVIFRYCAHIRCASSITSLGSKSPSLSTRQPSATQKLWVHLLLSCYHFSAGLHSFVYMLRLIPGRVQRSGETADGSQRRLVPAQHHSGLHPPQHPQQMCASCISWFEQLSLTQKQRDFNMQFVTCCSRWAVSTACPASCGQTRPWPSKPQDRRLSYGVQLRQSVSSHKKW